MKRALEEVREDSDEAKKQVKQFELILNGKEERTVIDNKRELKDEPDKIKCKVFDAETKIGDLTKKWGKFRVEFEDMREKMEKMFEGRGTRKQEEIMSSFSICKKAQGDDQDHDKKKDVWIY
ncbi:hypothetical protein E2C01_066454 [Portunus trituberculatus]|uniref:Uncharacterized protein n=1 Tax=Portunus trituberculatus TaxID=210409 RepID=A0A5B7HI79_PORTR|nr:hypothetical protein [Portunus trituberculatus]